jgi:hypothetical protein
MPLAGLRAARRIVERVFDGKQRPILPAPHLITERVFVDKRLRASSSQGPDGERSSVTCLTMGRGFPPECVVFRPGVGLSAIREYPFGEYAVPGLGHPAALRAA